MEQLMESPMLLAGAAVALVLGGMAAAVVYFLYFSPPPSAEGATSALTLKLRARRLRSRSPRAANVPAAEAPTAFEVDMCRGTPPTLRLPGDGLWLAGKRRRDGAR